MTVPTFVEKQLQAFEKSGSLILLLGWRITEGAPGAVATIAFDAIGISMPNVEFVWLADDAACMNNLGN